MTKEEQKWYDGMIDEVAWLRASGFEGEADDLEGRAELYKMNCEGTEAPFASGTY